MPVKADYTSYVVVGSHRYFPLDMLRYGDSWPACSIDAAAIELILAHQAQGLPKRAAIRLNTIIDRWCLEPRGNVYERWKSFGWSVLTGDDADGAIRKFSEDQERLREEKVDA